RAWADVVRGQVTGGTADVAMGGVNVTLAAGLEPLALQAVSGRVGGKRLANGFRFETQALQFVTEEGHHWPGGNVAVTWTDAEGQAPAKGELQADRLDLGALSLVATRLPLGTPTHAALQAYAPQGLVETLRARWQGPLGALQSYEARGRASGLQVAARAAPGGKAGTPGLRGAAVDFDFTHEGGKARLALADGALEFPGVFQEPVLPMDRFAANVQWRRDAGRLRAVVDDLAFANADAEGAARFEWRASADGGPGTLDLDATIARANGARVWRYLPLGVNHEAREYVRDAVLAGSASDARFRVRGDLHHFPFADGRQGEFLVTALVRDVALAYVPHPAAGQVGRWPALAGLAGELVFQGDGMHVRNVTGRFANAPRLQVKVDTRIPHFARTEVHVNAQVGGPLADSLAIVNASPLAATLHQVLARSTGSGNADVDLALVLPVHDLAHSQVRGTVTLAGNDVQITPDSPLLSRARGAVQF
ncbi:MAG: TIGR02099 family protein, partial [Comamonadaceae bacterium]